MFNVFSITNYCDDEESHPIVNVDSKGITVKIPEHMAHGFILDKQMRMLVLFIVKKDQLRSFRVSITKNGPKERFSFCTKPKIPLRKQELTAFLIYGYVDVTIVRPHNTNVSVITANNATVRMFLSGGDRAICKVLKQSTLSLSGQISALEVPVLADTGILDLRNIDAHYPRTYVLTENTCHERIILERQFKDVETSRERYVQTKISVPVADDSDNDEHSPYQKYAECQLCCQFKKPVVFVPCRHVLMCAHCAESMRTTPASKFHCPLCRTPIEKVRYEEGAADFIGKQFIKERAS